PARGHGPAGTRLQDARRDQSAAHLLRRLRLRPYGPGAHDGGLRRQAAGDVRDHVDHRRARGRADARGVRDLRHHRRHDGRAGDGYLVLAVLTEKQFASLMRTLGRADALEDPRFKDWPARTDNEAALREVIETALAKDDPKSWEARLTAADVPCATVWKIEEITRHPQLEHRDVLQTIDSRYGPMRLRSEEHTSELQLRGHLVCRLLLEKKKITISGLGLVAGAYFTAVFLSLNLVIYGQNCDTCEIANLETLLAVPCSVYMYCRPGDTV